MATELAQLSGGAPESLLDDPDPRAGELLSARLASLREQVQVARRTAEAARARCDRARRAVLAAEAEELQRPLAEAQAALAAHDKGARGVLKALENFTGAQYREVTMGMLTQETEREAGTAVGLSFRPPKRHALQAEVARWERRRQVALAAARGEDPRAVVPDLAFEDLTASLRPGVLDLGLVDPATASAQSAAAVQREVVEFERAMQEAQEALDGLRDRQLKLPHADLRDAIRTAERMLEKATERCYTARGRAGLPVEAGRAS